MSKLGFRMLLNVLFHSLPVTTVVTNFLDRDEAGQRPDFKHSFCNSLMSVSLSFSSFDVDLVLVFPKMYTEIIKI
jgi:hypothetical protein